jgi:TrmH family RNA methyltransferase
VSPSQQREPREHREPRDRRGGDASRELIRSAANPLVKRLRQLGTDRRARRREGAFVVHGTQPVWQAVEAGAEVETLVTAPGLLAPAVARMVAERRAAGTRVAELSDELFARISDRDGPGGLAAIVRTRPLDLADLPVPPGAVFVALHEIGNPGNLGTVIRTADATGTAGVVLVGRCTDPYDPAAVKASMGALFGVPVAHAADADALFGWARKHGVTVATTSARAPHDFWAADYPRPLAVLLGAEGPGLPDALVDRGDLRLRIPMTGTAESLNLAVSAALVMYEAWRHAPR